MPRAESVINELKECESRIEWSKCLCGICPAGCWGEVGLQNGKLVDIRQDASHTLGMICRRGRHAPEIVYSEYRLKYPMKRVGSKGSYSFERITWDEAYNIMVEELNRIKEESGPEAMAIYTGRGAQELSLCDLYQPKGVIVSSASNVLFPFGSPNTTGVGALCYVSLHMIASHVTMGRMQSNMFADIENADMLLVWGACGMRYPTFYDYRGQTGKTPWTHFWYLEFQRRPMRMEDFHWLFVSVEMLSEMREWTVQKGFAANDIGRVANRADSYAVKHLHYYTDRPDVPPSYVEVQGKITPGCRLSNPDWQWESLKKKGEFLGNCEDTLYMGSMLLKSLNIATGKGNVKAEGLAHAVILYFDAKDDVLRTTSYQLGVIERRAKGEIVYRYYHIPWDNLHHREDSIVVAESSDKNILEEGISPDCVLKWS